MSVIYYIETNLLCVIILMLLYYQHHKRVDSHSLRVVTFDRLIWYAIIVCVSDMLAGVCRGCFFPGARIMIELSNLIYFESIVLVGYQWMRYVFISLEKLTLGDKKFQIVWSIPLILISLLLLSNPYTHILFNINDENLYARNWGTLIHWVVAWFYLIVPMIYTAIAIRREKNKYRRREIIPFLYFVIAPALASLTQMLFYGVTSIQIGITISILLLFLSNQGREILRDALTGLNNRRGLENFFVRFLQSGKEAKLFIVLLDLNHFKRINDSYGHIVGDQALCEAADLLRAVCSELSRRIFICRYGGDEFLLAGTYDEVREIDEICSDIDSRAYKFTSLPVQLSFAIGSAYGKCTTLSEIEELLDQADKAMYRVKKSQRGSQNCGDR